MYRLKVNGWIKMYLVNTNRKKVGVAISVSNRTNFKERKVNREKEGHFIMRKGSNNQKHVTTLKFMCLKSKCQNM